MWEFAKENPITTLIVFMVACTTIRQIVFAIMKRKDAAE